MSEAETRSAFWKITEALRRKKKSSVENRMEEE
jgi:hypothetical protein